MRQREREMPPKRRKGWTDDLDTLKKKRGVEHSLELSLDSLLVWAMVARRSVLSPTSPRGRDGSSNLAHSIQRA